MINVNVAKLCLENMSNCIYSLMKAIICIIQMISAHMHLKEISKISYGYVFLSCLNFRINFSTLLDYLDL